MIRVAVKEPNKPIEMRQIENTLKPLQKLVGGYIEVVWLENNLCVVCDEDGISNGHIYNCCVSGIAYVGTIVVVASDNKGNFIGITDEQYRRIVDVYMR